MDWKTDKLYTAEEYLKMLQSIYDNLDTYYAWGAIGSPANKKNRDRYGVPAAPPSSFLFDCSGYAYKAIPLEFTGDKTRTYGGADPGKAMDLFNCNDILKYCYSVSTDFSKIEPCELLYMKGHVGIYRGEGTALECTSDWENGVQITLVNNCTNLKDCKHSRTWLKHGKLPFIMYKSDQIMNPEPVPEYTQARFGEGLIRIARRVGITVDEIKRLNPDIKGPVYLVRLGQKVRIK